MCASSNSVIPTGRPSPHAWNRSISICTAYSAPGQRYRCDMAGSTCSALEFRTWMDLDRHHAVRRRCWSPLRCQEARKPHRKVRRWSDSCWWHHPRVGDSRFEHAVILMVRHDKTGALGIVVNRPIEEIPLAKLLQALGQDGSGVTGQARIFAGGPVEPQIGFILHTTDYHRAGTIRRRSRGNVPRPPDLCAISATIRARGQKPHCLRLCGFGARSTGRRTEPGCLEDSRWMATPGSSSTRTGTSSGTMPRHARTVPLWRPAKH